MMKKETGRSQTVVRKTPIKIVVVMMVVLAIVVTVVLINKSYSKNTNLITYQLNNKQYRLLVANGPKLWERGLMFIKKKENFDGMIFYFPEKDFRSFWNKNTLIDLEIYWLIDNQIVGRDQLPAVTKSGLVYINSPQPVNRVIEIIK